MLKSKRKNFKNFLPIISEIISSLWITFFSGLWVVKVTAQGIRFLDPSNELHLGINFLILRIDDWLNLKIWSVF